ncbi:hypothetical protein OQA88_9215 [Cercophora sp. LCS_1]
MTYYPKSEDWLHHSSLLLQAQAAATPAAKPPRGHLVLKTYDPVSGVTLKYKTSKAAEVSRLIQMLGQLGRRMAALPDVAVATAEGGDVVVEEGDGVGRESGTATPVPGQTQSGGAGAQGKKKKKGRR